MKGQITKSFSVGTLVKKDDLILLNNWVKSKFSYVTYSIKTSNGANFDIDTFEEVIEYDNPSSRKIIVIYINANKEAKTYNIYNDLSISLLDNNRYRDSITYTIRNMNQEELESYSNKLDELVKNFKSPYAYMNSVIVNIILMLIIWLPFYFFALIPFYKIAKIEGLANQLIVGNIIAFMIAFLFSKALIKILIFFFPESIFLIGRQIQFNERKKKLRHTIGVLILLAIVVSVVSALIANYLFNI